MSDLTPVELIQSRIQNVREVRVILDTDLANLYRVSTSRLNEAVKRNSDRFPADFRFQLTPEEVTNLGSQTAISSGTHGGRRSLPYAFTEYGALMAANVLNSPAAVTMSVQVIRAFIQLRQLLVNHKQLAAKLTELDARVGAHDSHLAEIIAAIRKLAAPEGPRHRRKIGFHSPAK
ncbi:MAG: ORF6N domain-containing protein [Opitutaceae bacterium]